MFDDPAAATPHDLEALPTEPLKLLGEWLGRAERESGQRNWNAMMVATASPEGKPSVRTVLLKEYDAQSGRIVFYTNYASRKGREIETNPRVAAVLYWDALDRQVRIEGRAERAPEAISDAYFASRPREHQLGTWASEQSEPLDRYETLVARALEIARRFAGRPIERPPKWGGIAIVPDSIEFWSGVVGRLHRRVLCRRDATARGGWTAVWLNP